MNVSPESEIEKESKNSDNRLIEQVNKDDPEDDWNFFAEEEAEKKPLNSGNRIIKQDTFEIFAEDFSVGGEIES